MKIITNGIKEEEKEDFIIETKNLTKIYGEGKLAVRALFNVNLKIKRGEFVTILGPSGSGKTTLLNMIGALDRPTSGKVIVDGIEISSLKEKELYKFRREKIGFVFQNYYLVPTLTALQNVLLPVFPLKKKEKDYLKRANDLFETLGIKGKEHRKPSQLSGGEQQRVAIARALILDPPLILADEPTGNLDSKTGAEIIKLLQNLNQSYKKTIIVVTHDERITKFSHKTLRLEDGKIVS